MTFVEISTDDITIKIRNYYSDTYRYIDYDLDGIYDGTSNLASQYSYYDSNGIQVFYESINRTLNTSAGELVSDTSYSLSFIDENSKSYSAFQITQMKTSYALLPYDKDTDTHLIK